MADSTTPPAAPPTPVAAGGLHWMQAPTQRGMKPVPGPRGLLLEDVDVESYGDVPDVWPYRSDTPRGAYPPPPHVAQTGSYSIFEKAEVWSENARRLYEDAIRDRWSSATDVPWQALQPLPEHLERALCQVCTQLAEQGYLASQIISAWFEKIAYGFHEIKNYLATEVYDGARQYEAFRKRALANGGGLGIEGPGIYSRVIATSLTFTELSIMLLVRALHQLVVADALHKAAPSDAERTLFQLFARDQHRHIAFHTGHLQYYLRRQPQMLEQVHTWLSRAELFLVADQRRDTAFNEALALLLGDSMADGRDQVTTMRRTFVQAYLHRLADAQVVDRAAKLAPELARLLPEAAAPAGSVMMRPPVDDPVLVD